MRGNDSMNFSRIAILSCCVLLLALPSCRRKQNLIDRAFEDKNFDQAELKQQDEAAEPEEEKEEEIKKAEVLVDNINPPAGESTFYPEGSAERPTPSPFKQDPEAPILNFEETKVYDVVHLLCKALGTNYIIDPSVKDQTITIGMVEAPQKMKTSELLDLVLKLHGLTMVWEGDFVRILPVDGKEVLVGLELLYGNLPNPNLMREELVIQIIPLRYTTPSAISSVLREFMSPSARLIEEPVNNLLIVIDKANYIRKIMELIPLFDINVLQNKKMVLYQLEFVDAVETVAALQDVLAVYGLQKENERVSIIPMETVNGIMVVSPMEEIFKEVEFWIEKLDREAQFEEPQVFIYEVENTTVDALTNTIGQIYGLRAGASGGIGGSAGASERRTTSPNRDPNDQSNRTEPEKTQAPGMPQIGDPNSRNLMITDKDNNALIFYTTPREYYRIRKTLKQLDVLPRQVFMEVTVLKVELNDALTLGIDWSLGDGEATTGSTTSAIRGTSDDDPTRTRSLSLASGLNFTYSYAALTERITAKLTALKTNGFANILQQPHIMALDNKSASINIGQEVPILTSNVNIPGTTGGTTSGSIVQTSNVQYRSTGVELTFTPHINANGVIRLEIGLGISAPGANVAVANNQPQINTNNLATEMIVRNNQTIIMGGIIADTEDWSKSTIPFLGRIPLLRHLFSNRKKSMAKTELVVMITPRVIDSEEKSIEVTNEFRSKILREFQNMQVE